MPASLRFIRQTWLKLLVGGALLFFGAEQALKLTGNLGFVPAVLLLGAFTIPAAFVTFFYGRERSTDRAVHVGLPLSLVSACFLFGGAIGVIVAASLEYETLRTLTVFGLFGVGLVEESAKLIFPVVIYMRARYRSEADGLLFGVASGMGFAALETMGYGLASLVQSRGNVGTLEETLLIRGLLSPVGHAAWTGLICGVLWRQREQTGRSFNAGVIWVFVLALVLHALWDIAGSFQQPVVTFAGFVIIGGTSFTLLLRRLREASRYATLKVAADER